MKKLLALLAIVATLSLSWSCEKEKLENQDDPGVEQPDDPNKNEATTITEITASIGNATMKTLWEEGDEILVYAITESGDVAAKYVLSSGAGTTTGKFVASGAALTSNATGYFATCPYNEDLTFAQHNTFAFTLEAEQVEAAPIFAYAENAAELTFNGAVGAVKVPLTGTGNIARIELSDNDAKSVINGNVTYNPKTTKFAIKNSAASKNMVTKVLAEKVELGTTPVEFVIDVPAGSFATGGALVLYDVNNSPLANIVIQALTIENGKVAAVETQEVVPVAQTVNLNSIQGYANTYQIPAVGKYKFEAVKGNDSSLKLDAATAELTWETWCNNEPVTLNSLVKSVTVEEGYVHVETADAYHTGNALVSVKDAAGTIVWSWMLWFTDVASYTNVEVDGVKIMDRNLGALTADVDKPGLNYGLLWQWGRHVPIMGLDGTHNTETPTAMTSAPAIEDERLDYEDAGLEKGAGFTIDFVLANPTRFFYSGNRQWAPNPLDETAGNLWAETKTIYDPCPAGYKVISKASASVIFAGISESTENDAANFGFKLNGMWFPYTGWWKYSGSARLTDATQAYFWTSESRLRSESDGYNVATHYQVVEGTGKSSYESKGGAFSVRCEVIVEN